jgi:glycosyltransferase involved in cell wall biosynthesis
MTGNPLVSVLMTCYNREKYIAFAIESVLASDYSDFELIIMDDGSTDATVSIVQKFALQDNRVRVYANDKNLGDYPNRNRAASVATGKYLKYVDSDDYIYPWGLKVLVSTMEQFPGAGWGICSLPQHDDKPFPFQLTPQEAYRYHYFGPGLLFHRAPLSSIIRRDVFEQVEGFRSIRMAGDFEMWHRLGQQFPVVLMPQGIIWYRKHGEQEIKSYREFLGVYESILFSYITDDKCPLTKEEVNIVLRKGKHRIRKDLIKALATFDFSGIKNAINRYNKH